MEINWQQIKDVLEVLIVPAYIMHVKRMSSIETKLTELSNVLIGVDGENGLRSRFKELERDVRRLMLALAKRFGMTIREDEDDV